MIINKRLLALLALLAVLFVPFCALVNAATDDVFAFIPPGGRTYLAKAIETAAGPEPAKMLLTGKRNADEWNVYLMKEKDALPSVKALNENQRWTFAYYLSHSMPIAAEKVSPVLAKRDLEKLLPPDGRDLTLTHCQSCHIITVVITQDRSREAWLGTMNKPSHIEIETTPTERETIADYLVLNAAISIDDVPEELRAGGASY